MVDDRDRDAHRAARDLAVRQQAGDPLGQRRVTTAVGGDRPAQRAADRTPGRRDAVDKLYLAKGTDAAADLYFNFPMDGR
ncbi:hypothetical protein AMK22_29610 [Streptomyces sp. CB01580]|nr:hypothetical protein AMK22_29610 [Streptomyces sp. CB01580]